MVNDLSTLPVDSRGEPYHPESPYGQFLRAKRAAKEAALNAEFEASRASVPTGFSPVAGDHHDSTPRTWPDRLAQIEADKRANMTAEEQVEYDRQTENYERARGEVQRIIADSVGDPIPPDRSMAVANYGWVLYGVPAAQLVDTKPAPPVEVWKVTENNDHGFPVTRFYDKQGRELPSIDEHSSRVMVHEGTANFPGTGPNGRFSEGARGGPKSYGGLEDESEGDDPRDQTDYKELSKQRAKAEHIRKVTAPTPAEVAHKRAGWRERSRAYRERKEAGV